MFLTHAKLVLFVIVQLNAVSKYPTSLKSLKVGIYSACPEDLAELCAFFVWPQHADRPY